MGQMIDFPSNGDTCPGYLAVPSSGSGPGIVVIQEYWGLVPHIKDVCDRLAGAGFTALAADLYHGKATREPDEAGKLMMAMRIDEAARDLEGAVSWLLQSENVSGQALGALGFCMGGGLALYLATLRPEIRACVMYYGVLPWEGVQPDLGATQAAVLGHFGERDAWNPREKVEVLEQQVRDAGKRVEFHWYDADHAFFNDARPEVYAPDAARLSWDRTMALFRQELAE